MGSQTILPALAIPCIDGIQRFVQEQAYFVTSPATDIIQAWEGPEKRGKGVVCLEASMVPIYFIDTLDI